MTSHDTTFAVNQPTVAVEEFEHEYIAVNLESGKYYSLADTAAAIWGLATAGRSRTQITRAMRVNYRSDDLDIGAATEDFLRRLVEDGLLVATPTDSTAEPTPVAADETQQLDLRDPQPFTAPTLDGFDDLQDLLLLDPIHDVDEAGWPMAPGN